MTQKHYDLSDGKLTKSIIEAALKRLGDLLQEKNKQIELVAAGGVISVLHFGSRQMTREIGDTDKQKALTEAIKYRNFSPFVDDEIFTKRFNRTWNDAFNTGHQI